MITSLNEFKKQYSNSSANESKLPTIQICPMPSHVEHAAKIDKICKSAFNLELTFENTLKVIKEVYTNPAKAPEDINVKFVIENLDKIVKHLDRFPKTLPIESYQYTSEMLNNKTPDECIMYIKDNAKIKQLTEALNIQIKKDNFKAIYENNIFFINNLDKLNDKNKNIVFAILKETHAKNIATQLKWTRIL